MYIIHRNRQHGKPITDQQIRRLEYSGALWKPSSLACRLCHQPAEMLLTPNKKEPRALRCPTCDQPANAGPLTPIRVAAPGKCIRRARQIELPYNLPHRN